MYGRAGAFAAQPATSRQTIITPQTDPVILLTSLEPHYQTAKVLPRLHHARAELLFEVVEQLRDEVILPSQASLGGAECAPLKF
jgi:hypothetical protein